LCDDCRQLCDDCRQLCDDCRHLCDDCRHLCDDCTQNQKQREYEFLGSSSPLFTNEVQLHNTLRDHLTCSRIRLFFSHHQNMHGKENQEEISNTSAEKRRQVNTLLLFLHSRRC
jgi:hypothetical protein